MYSLLMRRVVAALLVMSAAIVSAQDDRFAVLMKHRVNVQTGATTTTADPETPYGFSAELDGTATSPTPPNSITLPNGGATKPLVYTADDEQWLIEQGFTSEAALTTAYPNGTYGLTVGGQTTTVALTGDAYPDAPVATLSQGTFANGILNFDRSQPLTITISYGAGFVAGFSRLAIEVDGFNYENDVSTDDSNFTQSQLSLVLPANSIPSGAELSIQLEANRILTLDATKIPGTTVVAAYTTHTRLTAQASGTPGVPQFLTQPISQTIVPGGTVVFTAFASNATAFSWRRNGSPIPNAFGPTLVLSGMLAVPATYTAVATNANGSIVSQPATLTVYAGDDVGRLSNLSIRAGAGTGAATLIVGLSVGGSGTSGTKPLLVRGLGPTLAAFLPNFLTDPVITMYQGETAVANNDNWGGDATIEARSTQVFAYGMVSPTSLDAALAPTPAPGVYSVHVTGKAGATGITLAEIYDASATMTATTPRLINVSARTQVGTGDNVLIAGFYIGGSTARTVLIRGLGPTLATLGVPGALADPQLKLYRGETMIRQNDNWNGDPMLVNIGNSVYAYEVADRQSKDAMILMTLAPGGYTVHVGGVNDTTGVALVEVYEVP